MLVFVIGLLLTFGAVGGMESPDNNLFLQCAIACVGLLMMYCGTIGIEEKQ